MESMTVPYTHTGAANEQAHLTARLPNGWTLALERRDAGHVDITLRSADGEDALLIGGYGQHPRITILDDGHDGGTAAAVLLVGSCSIMLRDESTRWSIAGFLGLRTA